MSQATIKKLAVVGLGLIGGSLAKAVRSSQFAEHVVAYTKQFSDAKLGAELGVIDQSAETIEEAVSDADIVVVAVPVRAFESTLALIKPHLKSEAVLTDVGSVKGSVIDAVKSVYGNFPDFVVPGHPIAGSEKSGVTAAKRESI